MNTNFTSPKNKYWSPSIGPKWNLSVIEKDLFYSSVLQLNAFDSRHLDEIYFDVRLTAFQDATRRVNGMGVLDLDYIGALLHNCFHTYEVKKLLNYKRVKPVML